MTVSTIDLRNALEEGRRKERAAVLEFVRELQRRWQRRMEDDSGYEGVVAAAITGVLARIGDEIGAGNHRTESE